MPSSHSALHQVQRRTETQHPVPSSLLAMHLAHLVGQSLYPVQPQRLAPGAGVDGAQHDAARAVRAPPVELVGQVAAPQQRGLARLLVVDCPLKQSLQGRTCSSTGPSTKLVLAKV